MLVTPEEIIAACPLVEWVKERFQVELNLVDGNTIVIRFDLKSLETVKFDEGMVREKFGPLLREKSDDVCSAIAANISTQLVLVAKDQLRIAQVSDAIIQDIQNKASSKDLLLLGVVLLRGLLNIYKEMAEKAGWPKFLRLCEAYAEQL